MVGKLELTKVDTTVVRWVGTMAVDWAVRWADSRVGKKDERKAARWVVTKDALMAECWVAV